MRIDKDKNIYLDNIQELQFDDKPKDFEIETKDISDKELQDLSKENKCKLLKRYTQKMLNEHQIDEYR